MKRLLSCGAALLLTAVFAAAPIAGAAESRKSSLQDLSENCIVMGRSAADGSGITMDDTAAGILFRARCSGTVTVEITARMTDSTFAAYNFLYFTVFVDGERQEERLKISGTTRKPQAFTLTLAENLPKGDHTFEFYRQTESQKGLVTLEAVTLDGTFLKPPEKKLRMEFIGDSITAGYGNLSAAEPNAGSPDIEDGTQSYAFLTARELNAAHSILAMEGHGLVGGWGREYNVPKTYPYTSWYRDHTEAGLYGFEDPADVVVVNLGTNDWATRTQAQYGNNITTLDFKNAVKSFSETIRAKNPDAKIVWAYGMMVSGTSGYNTAIVEAVAGMGGEKSGLYTVALPFGNHGAGGHPDIAEQQAAADTLTAFLKERVLSEEQLAALSSSNGGLSTGAIIAVAAGAAVFLAGIGVAIAVALHRKRKKAG